MDEFDNLPDFPDDQFWSLVSLARQDFTAFTTKLEGMNRDDLIGFAWKFEDLAGCLHDDKCHQSQFSEDYLEDLCGWVVGQGRTFYENVRHNPDQMPEEVDSSELGIEIQYEASVVYYDRFGEEMPPLEGT